ncbi:hypothetical protein [Streptomyces sp. NPDC059402]|uniref:hypothetical protein n=1 Tax=Streptomyces sp. NPDC059402 TaxID=3346822 RepID=UPI00368C17DB
MAEQPTTAYRLTPRTLDLFVRAVVEEVDYDIHKGYESGEEDGLDHYPELVAQAAKMLDAITAGEPAASIADAQDPTPLRWGLNDVLWSDDNSVTVMLSGPGGEPYWLELDAERAAVLRTDLAGPNAEAQR